jgi:hypothetical protein
VKRRDHQILLGLAKRHSPRKKTPIAAPAAPSSPRLASLEDVSPPSRAA